MRTKKNSATKPVTTDVSEEKSMIRKISLVSIIGNIILSGFKLFAGIFGNSGAMISDAVHSLSDVFTTFIALIGIKISKKGPDEKHPYGHERFEGVASVFLGVLLFITGVLIGKEGLSKIIEGNYDAIAIPGTIALVAAVSSIVVKEAMYWYTRYYAKKLNSSVFMADAWHHRSDAFSSVGSLIGVAGAMLGFPILDAVASVVICLFILKVSVDIIREALKKLTDTSCGKSFDEKLSEYVSRQKEVLCVDSLHSRMFGDKVYVDLEIRMDGNRSLRETHEIVELIHENVEREFPNIKHIMIHVNPEEADADKTPTTRNDNNIHILEKGN